MQNKPMVFLTIPTIQQFTLIANNTQVYDRIVAQFRCDLRAVERLRLAFCVPDDDDKRETIRLEAVSIYRHNRAVTIT